MKVAIVGPPKCGKTTLIEKLREYQEIHTVFDLEFFEIDNTFGLQEYNHIVFCASPTSFVNFKERFTIHSRDVRRTTFVITNPFTGSDEQFESVKVFFSDIVNCDEENKRNLFLQFTLMTVNSVPYDFMNKTYDAFNIDKLSETIVGSIS